LEERGSRGKKGEEIEERHMGDTLKFRPKTAKPGKKKHARISKKNQKKKNNRKQK